MMLDKYDLYASAGSACLADSGEPSHVISAMHGFAKGKRCKSKRGTATEM